MASAAQNKKTNNLTRLLLRINSGEDTNLLRREAFHLLPEIGPDDMVAAQQHLIDNGHSTQLVQLLSAMFMVMAVPKGQNDRLRTSLPANHLLRVIMLEHDIFRYLVADLSEAAEAVARQYELADVSSEFRRLSHIVEHLTAMKRHIEREDDVIFPWLANYGRLGLCCAVQTDHPAIITEIDSIAASIVLFDNVRLDQFKRGLLTSTRRLAALATEHLTQEDEILYPIAQRIIDDSEVWERIKAFCDEIGYCGIHL
jgi:DUF438 domain-containing protein